MNRCQRFLERALPCALSTAGRSRQKFSFIPCSITTPSTSASPPRMPVSRACASSLKCPNPSKPTGAAIIPPTRAFEASRFAFIEAGNRARRRTPLHDDLWRCSPPWPRPKAPTIPDRARESEEDSSRSPLDLLGCGSECCDGYRLNSWRSQLVGATPSDMNSFSKGGVYGTRKTGQAFH